MTYYHRMKYSIHIFKSIIIFVHNTGVYLVELLSKNIEIPRYQQEDQ